MIHRLNTTDVRAGKLDDSPPFATATIACVVLLAMTSCGCDRNRSTPAPPPNSAPAAATAATRNIAEIRQAGLAALEQRELEKADELARLAMAEAPDDPENIYLLTAVLAEQNRFAEAIKRLEDLVDEVPSARHTLMGQTAAWMVEQGRWLEAEERCFEILDQLPDAVPVHRLLVQLYTRQGRRLDAARHLRYLCQRGNIEEQELHGLIQTFYSFSYDPDEEEYEPIGELGAAHYQICAGDLESALAILQQLSDRNPGESALLGRILAEQQQFDQLAQWAAEVPDEAQVTSDYWFAMGVHHEQQGEHVEAIKNLCAAVARDYTDAQAYVWLSRSLEAIGAGTIAAEAANRAELINLTKQISTELMANSPPNPQMTVQLIDLLDLLQRPFEALAWRAVLLAYAGADVPQSELQQRISEINTQRLQLLQQNEPMPSRTYVLCGITPELFQAAEAENNDNQGSGPK